MNLIVEKGKVVEVLSDIKDGPMRIENCVFEDGVGVELLFRLAHSLRKTAREER